MIKRETLDTYVRRVLKARKLTLSDLERGAEGGISDSYVSSISSGNITNVTVGKLKALARGLGVTDAQIFSVVCNVTLPDVVDFEQSDFAELFKKYRVLCAKDREELHAMLEMFHREIERRLSITRRIEDTPNDETQSENPGSELNHLTEPSIV